MTDPIADMLTRIRNAYMAGKSEVLVPHSKIKFAIAKILETEKYIEKAEKVEDKFDNILIKLKYKGKTPAISSIKRISKSGRRIYVGKNEVPKVLNNLGVAILTTSQGIMTGRDAKKASVGGEVICEVY